MIHTNQVEGQSMLCPNNLGDFYLTDSEVFEWGGGIFCQYERDSPYARSNIQIQWESADTDPDYVADKEFWCTGQKESITEYRSVWSSTHYAYVWTPYAYDGFEDAMQMILSNIESQNIALSCNNADNNTDQDDYDFDGVYDNVDLCIYDEEDYRGEVDGCPEKQDDEISCPEDFPYLWSDGLCYDQPESDYLDNGCHVDSPYLWSDGLCYDQPESDYLDNGCHVDFPYLWSDGLCYDQPESAKDTDDDGISDDYDDCSTQAETINNYQDDDGCPDESAPNIVFPTKIPDYFFKVNGCGAQNAVIDVIPDFDFSKSCDQHDICYTRGGDAKDREICDEQLYESIKSNSVLGKYGAWTYWKILRWQGEPAFNCMTDSCK